MSEHELEKLLGGFAADTLTAEEKRRLYAAALQDQQLFNALADEQALKELLADPAVRRRLLEALRNTTPSATGSSLPWLTWFRRPANLALAGGFTVAVFAVVLGTKVYQQSLEQAAQSVATEGMTPTSPPASAPVASQSVPPPIAEDTTKSGKEIAQARESATKEMLSDKMAKGEQPAPATLQVPKTPNATTDVDAQPREQDEARRPTKVPHTRSGKSSTNVGTSTDQKPVATPAPQASELRDSQLPAKATDIGATAPTVSARALFYGESSARPDSSSMPQETEPAMKSMAESTPQEIKSERMIESMSKPGRAKENTSNVKPLGLRYSFVMRKADGQDREVDKETALKNAPAASLTVEVNQDSYIEIWETRELSTLFLLFPDKDSGEISSKMIPGQRRVIPLPTGAETITIRVSRSPLDPVMGKESLKLDRSSPYQLHETITTQSKTGLQGHAHYVVNTDTNQSAHVVVEIPLTR
ncbi:hypothetical protein [Petrachloros mirabilis]